MIQPTQRTAKPEAGNAEFSRKDRIHGDYWRYHAAKSKDLSMTKRIYESSRAGMRVASLL
jgi:hypothetical protein